MGDGAQLAPKEIHMHGPGVGANPAALPPLLPTRPGIRPALARRLGRLHIHADAAQADCTSMQTPHRQIAHPCGRRTHRPSMAIGLIYTRGP